MVVNTLIAILRGVKNFVSALLSWWSETFTRQGLGGKLLFGCGTLLIICLVFGAISNTFSPKYQAQPTLDVTSAAIYTSVAGTMIAQIPTHPPSSTLAPIPTNTPAPTLDAKESLKGAIQTALGTGNRKVPRIRTIGFDVYETGDIKVEWSINDNLTESMIKFGARDDATNILKAVAQSGINYTSVVIEGYFPIQDVYGNSSDSMVIDLVYLRSTVDKINWSNFLSDNIYRIADRSENGSPIVNYVHPSFEGQ
jgi:hypothetical protein